YTDSQNRRNIISVCWVSPTVIAAACLDRFIRFFDVSSSAMFRKSIHAVPVGMMGSSEECVVVGEDGSIEVIPLNDSPSFSIPGHAAPVLHVGLTGNRLFSADINGIILEWAVGGPNILSFVRKVELSHSGHLESIHQTPESAYLLYLDGTILDLATEK